VIHAWLVYVAAAFWTVSNANPSVSGVCPAAPQASLKLERHGRSFLVPVTIQDKPTYLVLNLAAPLSYVTPQGADRLGLPVTRLSDSALEGNGKLVKTFVSVSHLAIGALQLPPHDLMVDPRSDDDSDVAASDAAARPIVGTLGVDLLRGSDIELDLAHDKMTLYSPGECGDTPVTWAEHVSVVPLSHSPNGSFFIFPWRSTAGKSKRRFPPPTRPRQSPAIFRSAYSDSIKRLRAWKRHRA
jgi:hypothetical protein